MDKLTKQINHYKPLIERVIASAESEYVFPTVLVHQLLLENKQFAERNRIYVLEILFHLHLAALITLRRTLSWIESIESSREHSVFFAFCSSLRGLIESSADSFYSLRYVPENLTRHFNLLKRCMERKESKHVHTFETLEDWGIHFLEAGKYEDKGLEAKHFKAKPSWEYLKEYDSEDALKPVYPLYQQLCQLTHPSRETTYLYLKNKGTHWGVENIDEKKEISELVESHDIEYEEIFQKSVNAALLVLWIIELFSIEKMRCPIIRSSDLSMIGDFRKLKKILSSNKSLKMDG